MNKQEIKEKIEEIANNKDNEAKLRFRALKYLYDVKVAEDMKQQSGGGLESFFQLGQSPQEDDSAFEKDENDVIKPDVFKQEDEDET